ncbi:intracellular sulfur oxidation DsrE/DsrF family protein [Bradyrhizobium japonicum USDA 38]|uniref:DsrE family protein n=1 Tax=Bradyrhizobium japonicum TaxID=375 RepID=UPI000481EF48|nr:DsrE family protein [Bradyrhizobium japonicum]MCS3894633.1 intracellular sulfur oxidation DsrE/DsrF family protein [Bradyrhizobium japonicum USDA 38]MCS3947147.1 intracellular sulfur oxidation DsrE/DsrF family protein [Bradyrhizobium japonicum]MCW2220023.1 intracellular sulfur oxidation DsrE/DsrF family protein [Bradyrhizobium japonicum]MCW2344637.1 intracellular sulfur oxidation DsrE/DsrF family protein [Bradyrhizobium japonicum]
MIRIGSLAAATIAGLIIALVIAPTAQAKMDDQANAQSNKSLVSKKKHSRQNQAIERQPEPATKPAEHAGKPHRLILQVNSNDPATMNLTLNNATNVTQYYRDLGERVEIEVVAFGPGLHMLRDDTSPVKARIEVLALSSPEISFKACGNTQDNMRKSENKDINLISQATIVKSGVIRVMELQEQGWSYVKP